MECLQFSCEDSGYYVSNELIIKEVVYMDPNRNLPRKFFRIPNFFPNLWEEMEDRMNQWMGAEGETGVAVSEDDKNVYVEAQLPGLKPNDIDVSFHQNTLWIKGEKKEEEEDKEKKYYRRARHSFFYQVELPTQVEENTEQAQFQDGVLKITFKKTQISQVRKIPITGGGAKTISKNNK
jgi:HSP20 family protein